MISRHHWIAAFIGRVLRQGHATDPDWVYDTADELYLGMCELDPEFADVPIVRKREDNANLNCVMSNSFGFGGTNATLVMKRCDA